MRLLALAAALALLLGTGGSARAQEPGRPLSFGVGWVTDQGEDSSWIVRLTMNPGERRQETFLVRNYSQSALGLSVYTADAQTGEDGQLGGATGPGSSRGAGLWLQADQDVLTMSRRTGAPLRLTVSVPPGTPPGDHLAWLFLQKDGSEDPEALAAQGDSGFQLHLQTRLGILVWVRVPGPAEARLVATPPQKTYADEGIVLAQELSNPGGLLVRGTMRWRLLDPSGVEAASGEGTPFVLLPGAQVRSELVLATERPLPRGTYRLELTLAPRGETTARPQVEAFDLDLP